VLTSRDRSGSGFCQVWWDGSFAQYDKAADHVAERRAEGRI
jgi:hypothetical protein